MSDVRLHLGDCLDFLRTLPDGSVDAVVTDPPYGTGERLRVEGQFIDTRQAWDVWDTTWLDAIGVTPFAVFCPPSRIRDLLLPGRRLLAWCSGNPVARNGVSPRYGIQSIVARGPFPTHYGLDWFQHRSNIQTPDHPHQKPVEVMEWLVETMCPRGGTILDPFMGSGTTGVACVNTGRKFIGIERDRGHFATAERRIAKAQSDRSALLFQPDAAGPAQPEADAPLFPAEVA